MRGLLSFIAVGLLGLACSSTSTNEAPSSGGSSGAASGGGGGSGGDCQPSPGPVSCFDCCGSKYPAGYTKALAALRPPICDQKICSPCEEGVCTDAGPATLSPTCQGCLYNDLVDGLAPLIEPRCKGVDPGCMNWLVCYHACSGN